MFVMVIPLVNIIMTVVWAFTGENESRKNYFKAVIIAFFVMIGFSVALLSLGAVPFFYEQYNRILNGPQSTPVGR